MADWYYWSWFECYLTNRQHYTFFDGQASSYLPVSSGVPQGSILGPLLFIIYTNDLPCNISSNVYSFADDTKLLHQISSFNDTIALQADLFAVQEWKLCLNESKCHLMSFSLKTVSNNTYTLNGSPIDTEGSTTGGNFRTGPWK